MAKHVHFEVQVQQGGRWSIHAQFGAGQRDTALEECKKVEKIPGITSVKLVKETYDSAEGSHQEVTVYRGPKGKLEHKGFRDIGGERAEHGHHEADSDWASARSYDDDGGGVARRSTARRGSASDAVTASVTRVVVRVLMAALVSLLVAGGFAWAFSAYFHGTRILGYKIVGAIEANAMFLVFVLSFLITSAILATTYLRNIKLRAGRRRPRARSMPPARPHAYPAAQGQPATGEATGQAPVGSEVEGDVGDWRQEAKAEESAAEMAAKLAGDLSDQAAEETNERLRQELQEGEGSEQTKRVVPPEPGPEDTLLSPHGEKQKAFMMKFLGDLLEVTGSDKKKLDNYTKFGINLFLAGSCEALSQKRDLDDDSRARILSDSVQVMGFKKSHAGAFANRYEEYLLQDARYMSMFQAGRNAMANHLTDGASGPKHLKSALEDWNKPKPKQEQAHVVAVLFTDIAGSTALTQQLGDAGAQEVVRAHNKIVRENLTRFQGKEVKHTGDGMMCSFDQPTNAVEAAIEIQRETIQFRAANKDRPLKLKVGINAGEPIAEDNDLFGTTVQLAARIVDKAQADQIFVSETVKGICTGKGFSFTSRGGYQMKGFSEDVQLYEVNWQAADAAKAS